MKAIFKISIALLVISSITACKKNTLISNNKTFSLAKFKSNLQTQLGTSIRGYCVVIGNNGQFADSIEFGFSATNPSSGATTPMTMNTYVNVNSVTKTLTAIAAIKLLDENGISLDSTIGKYLPAYWNAHVNVRGITFKELLSHSSGLRQSNTSYDSLKATCSGGLEGSKNRVYANINFALFRALLPAINNLPGLQSQAANAANNNTTANFEQSLSQQYIALMQSKVFTPAGIANAGCNVNAVSPVTSCFSEGPGLTINSNTDWTELCGGGGYFLTTLQMAQVMAYLVHSTTLLSASQKEIMNSNLYGWDPEDSPTTTAGKAHGKDGAWRFAPAGLSSTAGMQTYVCAYPNKIDVAISINSLNGGSYRNMATLALNAYESSWD